MRPGHDVPVRDLSTTVPSIAIDYSNGASCSPEEGRAIAGGGDISPLDAGVLDSSHPDAAGNGWVIRYTRNGADPGWPGATITTWVTCAG